MSNLAVTLEKYILPKNWQLLPLSALAENPKNDIVDGPFGSNLKAGEYTSTGVPILRLQNIKRNYFLNKNIKYVSQEKYEQLIRHTYKSGDLIITKLGAPLGVACIAPKFMNEGLIVADLVRARLSEQFVYTKYVSFLINSPLVIQQFKENTKGTTRPRVNLKFVRDLQLPIAPYAQQIQIITKIEELFSNIDAAISALNKSRGLIKQYQQSILKAATTGELTKQWRTENKEKLESSTELFKRIINARREKWEAQQIAQFKTKGKAPKGNRWKEKYIEPKAYEGDGYTIPDSWIMARAEQVCEFITKGTTPKSDRLIAGSGQIPFIKVYNLTFDTSLNFDLKPTFTDTETHEKFLARSKVYPGDVLMNIVGPPLGKVSIVSDLHEQWNINQAIAIYRPIAGLNNKLLAYFLLSSPVVSWMLSRTKTTAGQVNLTLEISRNAPIPIMEKKEQEEIVKLVEEKLASANRLLSEVDSQLVRAEKTKQSILASAFSGKLI